MNNQDVEKNLEARAELFKALGHPTRLLILNLVRQKPRHGQELATILNLQPATISHHLGKLAAVGLLDAQRAQYYQTYSLIQDLFERTLGEMVQMTQPGLTDIVEEDAYREKVLRTFFQHGRLKQIPRQLKKWQVVLSHIAEEFEPGRDYPEMEVNHMLLEFNEDVASLRRGLVSNGFMTREKGIYRRVPNS